MLGNSAIGQCGDQLGRAVLFFVDWPSAGVSLSPDALPPRDGNVHERPTRRAQRKKGMRSRIDL